MRRGARGLQRRARLRSDTPLRSRTAILRRTPLRRSTGLAPASERARKVAAEWDKAKRAALRRSKGRCEVCGRKLPKDNVDGHHRLPRRYGDHSTANCIVAHRECHNEAFSRGLHRLRDRSISYGLILTEGQRPAQVPVRLPDGRLVLLGDSYKEVSAA